MEPIKKVDLDEVYAVYKQVSSLPHHPHSMTSSTFFSWVRDDSATLNWLNINNPDRKLLLNFFQGHKQNRLVSVVPLPPKEQCDTSNGSQNTQFYVLIIIDTVFTKVAIAKEKRVENDSFGLRFFRMRYQVTPATLILRN